MPTSSLFGTTVLLGAMSLTSDDFSEFVEADPNDDETVPLGDALAALAVDVDIDSVAAVRDVREEI